MGDIPIEWQDYYRKAFGLPPLTPEQMAIRTALEQKAGKQTLLTYAAKLKEEANSRRETEAYLNNEKQIILFKNELWMMEAEKADEDREIKRERIKYHKETSARFIRQVRRVSYNKPSNLLSYPPRRLTWGRNEKNIR